MRRRLCLFPSDPCRPQNRPLIDPLSDARSQKRSPTTWILNGVCGSGKWGRAGVLNKRPLLAQFCGPTNAAYVERHDGPRAAFRRTVKMLQRGPAKETFVHVAAFCQLKCRSADKVTFRCEHEIGNPSTDASTPRPRSGHLLQVRI
jgi:hypothetical protein